MMVRTSIHYNKGYHMKELMAWRTIYSLYTLSLLLCLVAQRVTSQGSPYRRSGQPEKPNNNPYSNNFQLDQSSGSISQDGFDYEDDDDEPMSSGGGPVSPPMNRPSQPGSGPINRPAQPGGGSASAPVNRPSQSGGAQPGSARPGEGGERGGDVLDSWKNPGRGDNNNRFPPLGPASVDDDDDDELYDPSGDIILEPERKGEVPRQGGEVDPPTQPPLYGSWSTAPRRPDGPSFDRSAPARPSDPWRPTTSKEMVIHPDDDWNTDSNGSGESEANNYKSAFFRIFSDPLVLAGIISGAVLALLCIVLIVMYMIYRMRKKDEGSYALGEPKRTCDIRYTRTKDQEFFA